MAVDNFGMGKFEFTLGATRNHKAVGLQTEPEDQDSFDKQVWFGTQLEFEDWIGYGAQTRFKTRVELEKQ